MKESMMSSPEQLKKIQDENMSEEQIAQTSEREGTYNAGRKAEHYKTVEQVGQIKVADGFICVRNGKKYKQRETIGGGYQEGELELNGHFGYGWRYEFGGSFKDGKDWQPISKEEADKLNFKE